MVVVAMFNLVLLLLNFFIGLRTENKAAAASSRFSTEPGPEAEERNATAAAASQAETWHRSDPVPVFGQLSETTQRG